MSTEDPCYRRIAHGAQFVLSLFARWTKYSRRFYDVAGNREWGSHWIDYDVSKPTCFTNRCRITDEQFMLATARDYN